MYASATAQKPSLVWQGSTKDGYTLRLTRTGIARITSKLKQIGIENLVKSNMNGSLEGAVVRSIAQIVSNATDSGMISRPDSGTNIQVFTAVGRTRNYQILTQPISSRQGAIISIRSQPKAISQEWEQQSEYEGEYERGHSNNRKKPGRTPRRGTATQRGKEPDISKFDLKGPVTVKLLREVHGPEFNNSLKQAGWREAPNGHILKRLKQRGPSVGINTLADFAREVRQGRTEPNPSGGSRRVLNITMSNGKKPFVVFRNDRTPGTLITLSF